MTMATWRNLLGPSLAVVVAACVMSVPALVTSEREARVAGSIRGAHARAVAPPSGGCAAEPSTGGPAWFRLDPVLDGGGRLIGRRLVAGPLGEDATAALDLAAESFAAGPLDGRILVASDDGRRSRISVVYAASGCVEPGYETAGLVRRALLDPAGDAVVELRLDRRSRADLGIWRRPLAGGDGTPLADPLVPNDRLGLIFSTELAWSAERDRIVITSCGESACLVRIVDPIRGPVLTIDDPAVGEAIGLSGSTLVAYGGCPTLPCSIVAYDLASKRRAVLAEAAGLAALVSRSDGPALAFEDVRARGRVALVALDGSVVQHVDLDGVRLIPGPHRAGGAVDPPPGHVPVGPGGRPAVSGRDAALLDVADRRVVAAAEAVR